MFFPSTGRSHARWRCALAACALVWLAAGPPADAQPLPERLLTDAADARLDDFDFLAAALIASGVELPCELEGWRFRYANLRDSVVNEDLASPPPAGRLPRLHASIHDRILIGNYETAATDVRLTLSRGDFNCLSALVIYYDLCRAAGHPLEIWLLPGHVYLRSAEQPALVIEPAHKDWNPARWHRPAPPGRQITPVELLAKVYYNRGVQQLQQHQFAAGLALLETSLRLDPADGDARENLAAGINNWAADQCRAHHYEQAAELIQRGLSVAPAFAPLVANERLVREKMKP
jgi:tetratricopeptide (TPR) repeat protein